jgi:hypothetical protein
VGAYVARTDDLVVEELDGGLVVYDKRRDQAHWLDAGAAAVWRAAAEGGSDTAIAQRVGVDAAIARASLVQLVDIGLVATDSRIGVSRRTVLRTAAKVGVAGVAAAPIVSAVIPIAAAHASTPGGGGPPPPQTVTYTIQSGPGADGTTDAKNLGSNDGGLTYGPTLIISNGAYTIIPGTSYIYTGSEATQNFYYKPSPQIVLPPGATGGTISGQFRSDNTGYVIVNGVQVASTPTDVSFSSSQAPTSFSASLQPGPNDLVFIVNNSGGPTALDYIATVSYTA